MQGSAAKVTTEKHQKSRAWTPLIFVTGKGGVGKSDVSCLLANELSQQGKSVLLVEMARQSTLYRSLGMSQGPTYEPQKTALGFDLCTWEGSQCLQKYVEYQVKIPFLAKTFINSSWVQAMTQIAPGLKEIAFLGQVTSQKRQHGPRYEYDHIIVDAVSTGHFLSLIRTPGSLAGLVSRGPLRKQSKAIEKTLMDPQVSTYLIVSLLEEYSVGEANELSKGLKETLGVTSHFVANKRHPRLKTTEPLLEEPYKTFLKANGALADYQDQRFGELRAESVGALYCVDKYFSSLERALEDGNVIHQVS